MANVMFKRGTQANLPVTAQDGVFYLTTDTGRLYVGQGTTMVELNKSIIEVTAATEDATTHKWTVTTAAGARPVKEGEFYYHAANNILMVGASNGNLVQVNPDTHITSTSSSGGINGNTFTSTYTLNFNNGKSAETLNTTITAGDNISLVSNGVNGVTIAADNSEITIGTVSNTDSGSTHTSEAQLQVDGGTGIKLKTSGENRIKFAKGTGDAANELTLTLPDAIAVPEYTAEHGGSNNHEQIVLKKDTTTQNTLTLADTKIVYGASGATTSTTSSYTSGTNTHDLTLDVYTTAQVDAKFGAIASAMDYMGATSTVPTAGSGASNALVAGDMWKVSGPISLTAAQSASGEATTAKIGDLLIYNGSTWDVIPSGDDQNIGVLVSTGDNSFTVRDGSNDLGQVKFDSQSGDTAIAFTSTATGTTGLTVKGNLKPLTTAPSGSYANVNAASSGTVDLASTKDVITGLTVDTYGRVTGYTKAKYVAPADQTLSISTGTSGTAGQISLQITGDTAKTVSIDSSSLKVTGGNNNTITIDLEWGSFDS